MQSIAYGQVMRRRIPFRKALYALIAAPSLLTALAAHAEEAPFISVVTGLAPDDLLNVRAKPSPIGKTEARLAAGASVRNLGCNDIDGHPWCKVESDNPKATGWAPARYLVPVNPATIPDQAVDAPAAIAAAPPVDGAAPAAQPAQPVEAPATPQSPPTEAPPADAPPPDLTERLGGIVHHPVTPEAPVKSAAATAMQDAYGLALAATETPTTAESTPPTATVEPQAQDDAKASPDAAAQGDAGTAAAGDNASAGSIPVPTPRPVPAGAGPGPAGAAPPAVDTQTVAELPPPPTALAAGDPVEIPCARYVGQPMTRCAATIVHKGTDKADITVTWPDGGTRIISFQAGMPAGSNARGDFRFTREGSLNMIRVGVSERFEITDTVAFGD